MANSGGGHIVIGVTNPQASEPLKIDGGVDMALKNGFKSWLEDVVPTLTDPPLTGFQVFEVLSDGMASSQIAAGFCFHIAA